MREALTALGLVPKALAGMSCGISLDAWTDCRGAAARHGWYWRWCRRFAGSPCHLHVQMIGGGDSSVPKP
jgi:hypothetical protein